MERILEIVGYSYWLKKRFSIILLCSQLKSLSTRMVQKPKFGKRKLTKIRFILEPIRKSKGAGEKRKIVVGVNSGEAKMWNMVS